MIGDHYRHVPKSRIGYLSAKILGTLDLHTHTRLRPVLNFLKGYIREDRAYRVLEVGCSSGINGFELSKYIRKDLLQYTGLDLDKGAIESANKISAALNLDESLRFKYADASDSVITEYEDNYFDIILFIDFLEHIDRPSDILKKLSKKIKNNGIFLVSVPTHLFPRVFGKEFHRKVGHVTEGFTFDGLESLFREINADVMHYRYNTGPMSSIGCAMYYRLKTVNKYINYLKCLSLYPFKFLDFCNSEKMSCSLFAVFRSAGGHEV